MGEFLERPNRFSVWVRLNGRPELAYLPNPGRLLGILTPGRPLLLKPTEGEVRKPRYTAVGTDLNGMLVSLDSTLPNRFFPHALAQGLIPPLAGWALARKESCMGAGRADRPGSDPGNEPPGHLFFGPIADGNGAPPNRGRL